MKPPEYPAETPEYSSRIEDLSLHEVTEVYGTTGLVERFFLSLEAAGIAHDEQVLGAFALASDVHKDQRRSNGPYIDHPLRVAVRVVDHFKINDKTAIIAALLHDSVEDRAFALARKKYPGKEFGSEEQARDVAFGVIGEWFGRDVRETVTWLTNPLVKKPHRNKQQKIYNDHTRELIKNSPIARVDKLSDFIDNAAGNHYTNDPELQRRLDRKYADLYKDHREGLYLPDSLLDEATRDKINEQLIRREKAARLRMEEIALIPGR